MLSRNARIRSILFSIYVLLYGGFVLINALSPDTMDLQPIDGVNLAILYGFVLIVGALVLAVIYGIMCGSEEASDAKGRGQ